MALMLPAVALTGCIKAPDVVIVDRRTALEEQAMGHRPAAERELNRAAVARRPAAMTRDELAAAGWRPRREDDAVANLFADAARDADRVEVLLLRRCIGEAESALLVQTRRTCTGGVDSSEVARLIERVNRNRRQVWAYMARVRRVSAGSARTAWRKQHLVELVCNGHVQTNGEWGLKKCRQ